MNFDLLREVLESEALAEGLELYEIYFTSSEGLSAETLEKEISSFSSGVSAGISFRCVWQGKMGSAATELFEENELRSLVRRAKANAEVIENGEQAVIFGGSDRYEQLDNQEISMPTVSDVKAIALSIQNSIYAQNELVADGTQAGVFAEKASVELANSLGLRLSGRQCVKGAYAQAVINKDGEAQDAFDFALDLESGDIISQNAVKAALSKLGAEEIQSGKYKVIMDGKQMRAMLSAFSGVFSGKNAMLGLSLLAGKEGEKIAADFVTLVDDPFLASGVATAFDGEGVATYKKSVIENGTLKTLLYDLAYAKKAGKQSTANGQRASYAQQINIAPFGFYIKGGELTDDQLIEKMGDGIYITELKGLHAGANAVTGDFSIESAGFVVKDGHLAGAVKGFTVAGNFFDMLKQIEAVARDVKMGMPSGFTTYGSPDVLLGEMSIAGK